jgi:hypothetical protein
MRITKEELEYLDITWFAVDKYGRILELTSAGSGHIPEFICESKENANILEDYFENKAINNFIDFSEKRLYYFDAYDGKNRTTNYIKKSSPSNPLLISQLPKHIFDILSNNRLNIDAESVDSITVEHAYSTEISLDHFVSLVIKGQFYLNTKNRYFSIDFKTKLKFKKIMDLFKKDIDSSFMKIKSTVETVDQTEIFKNYYEITTSRGEFILYIVYKCDIIIYDKGGFYSLQISKKHETVFDFNDKPGV